MDDLIEKMVRAADEAIKPVDAAIVIASIHGHCLPDGEPPMYAAMRAALHAISASGEWAVVPAVATHPMLMAAVQDGMYRQAKSVEETTQNIWQAMLQSRPKV